MTPIPSTPWLHALGVSDVRDLPSVADPAESPCAPAATRPSLSVERELDDFDDAVEAGDE